MNRRTLLLLDFDGVICDSALECYETSLEAYASVLKKQHKQIDVHPHRADAFYRLRPYIRNSEDYIVIQIIIDEGGEVGSQRDFDEVLARYSEEERRALSHIFYDVRSRRMKSEPSAWLESNPLYPHMKPGLARYASNRRLYILSTKRADFIDAIFSHNEIELAHSRILDCRKGETKLERASRLLDAGAGDRAFLVDDQISHLESNLDQRITTCLPRWGYIDPNALQNPGNVRIIDEQDMLDLFRLLE
jgi:phosphoglycolate phosphatase-like HAD superfamily hydrolase